MQQALNQAGLELASVTLHMHAVSEALAQQMAAAAQQYGIVLAGKAIGLTMTVDNTDSTVNVNDFGDMYITRSFTLPVHLNPDLATVVRYDEREQEFVFVPTVFEVVDGIMTATFKRPGNSIYTVITADKTFDDIELSSAKQSIQLLAAKQILKGISTTSFAPERVVTRAEFTTMLVRALGLYDSSFTTDKHFQDVPQNRWYYESVMTAATIGLVQGTGNDSFSPSNTITREQVAVMTAQALYWLHKNEVDATDAALIGDAHSEFVDAAAISTWATDAVVQLVSQQLIEGESETIFAPQQAITRAEAADILSKLLKHVGFIN